MYQCGASSHDIILAGTLLYHSSVTDAEIFDGESKKKDESLLSRISIPDIGPLMFVIVTHWKTSLAIVAVFAVSALLIYAFGPTVIIAFIKIVAAIIEMLLRTLFACLGGLFRAYLQRNSP